jgi:predicted extracellular nuclease
LTNTTAALRLGNGAQDTDDNAADFDTGAPNPRNSGDDAPAVSATTPVAGAANVLETSNITVTFSEEVNVTDPWFTINCATTGAHDATDTGGPTTFTLDPTVDFGPNETCTVTILASQVTDQDANDPPDTMAEDEIFSFTTGSACGQTATRVHDVQGNGAATPISGQVVTIEGVVVGDYQAPGQFSGYYLQEEDVDADADPATSEGLFVFNTSFPVAVGDTVRVTGTAGEFSGQTQLSSVQTAVVCPPTGSVTPTTVTFPVAAVGDLERFEGMSIDISQELTVTEVFTLARFGEAALSVGGRLDNPTNEVAPGAPAIALQNLNDRSRILLDDGNNQQNIDPTFYPDGGLSASNTLRVGDTLPSLSGVLGFGFGAYRVQPVDADAIAFTSTNPRPVAPAAVGGNVQVAAFNVLNYFNGDGAGGGFPTARGAENAFEFQRQRDKIISAMTALDADVVGLMELENDDTDAEFGAIEDLVAGLNAATAPGTYDFIDTGVVGTDQIRVGILYQPASVTPVGAHAIIDSSVDPRFIDTLNRPSIAQTFELNSNGGRFTAVVNHLKSKGSDCNAVGDPDIGDGQGNCNLTRTAAAEALVDWLAGDPTGSGDPDVVVLGDMNAYAMEDPISVFRAAGYVDTIDEFVGDDAYSFVFQGQSGYLDHALANPTLAGQVTGVTEWHVNADEPIALDYNTNFKSPNHVNTLYDPGPYRSSDHDPVVIGLDLAGAVPGAPDVSALAGWGAATVSWTAPGSDITGYTVRALRNGVVVGSASLPGDATEHTFGGLANGVVHTFEVTATNASGTGPAGTATATPFVPRNPLRLDAVLECPSFTATNPNAYPVSVTWLLVPPGSIGADVVPANSTVVLDATTNRRLTVFALFAGIRLQDLVIGGC